MNPSASSPNALLIIDDHPVYREALGEVLQKEFSPYGIQVCTAGNASEGIELVDQSTQNWIVLLDVLMPGLDGFEVCQRLKADPRTQSTPVIFITGLDAKEDEMRALALRHAEALDRWLYRVPGGLVISNIGACAIFAAFAF